MVRSETARFIITATPAVMGPNYFRAIAQVVAAGRRGRSPGVIPPIVPRQITRLA
jgi:hypothetical protein